MEVVAVLDPGPFSMTITRKSPHPLRFFCPDCPYIGRVGLCPACMRCLSCCACRYCSQCSILSREHEHVNQQEDLPSYTTPPPTLSRYKAYAKHQCTQYPYKRLMSLEVEVGRFTGHGLAENIHAFRVKWPLRVITDGSLRENGRELLTPPMSGDFIIEFMEDFQQLLKVMGAEATERAGLHVHIDCRNYPLDYIMRVCRYCAEHEAWFYRLVPGWRRLSTYCKPLLSFIREAPLSLLATNSRNLMMYVVNEYYKTDVHGARTQTYDKGHKERYCWVNLHSYFHRGTLEFRLPEGTTNTADMIGWARLFTEVVERAGAMQLNKIYETTPGMLVSPETLRWAYYRSSQIPG